MNRFRTRRKTTSHAVAALVASSVLMASPFLVPTAWSSSARSDPVMRSDVVGPAWRATAMEASELPPGSLIWSFAASQQTGGNAWTSERGRMTPGASEATLQPDTSRRVVLVSPGGLPESVRKAEEFVVGVAGDAGLQRVRIQARRDPRGGWITIADGKGAGLRATPSGIALKRTAGSRDQPIESLRVELSFRTTNPRPLTGIAAVPAPR